MSILKEPTKPYTGIGNIWFKNIGQSYFVTIGTCRDEIPCPASAFIKLSNNNFQKSIVFEAMIYKSAVNHNTGYFVKTIGVPRKHTKLIPKDTKNVDFRIEIML